MKKNKLETLINKYEKNEYSEKEKELIEEYLKSFQEEGVENWDDNILGSKSLEKKKIYSRVSNGIEKNKAFRRIISPVLINKAAAIIFLLIMLTGGLYWTGIFENDTTKIKWQEIETTLGERASIMLSDGSMVILNAGSKLKYPEKFHNNTRDIFLNGEAYFEVQHDAKYPFIVHTNNISTTVLGTKFNVSAYEEDKDILVSLVEGKVKVSKQNKNTGIDLATLKPEEKLIYDKIKDKTSFGSYDSLIVLGWKNGIYKFENKPLKDVLRSIERAFDVKFIVSNQLVLNRNITITFEQNSLETVINVLESLTGLHSETKIDQYKRKEIQFY